MARHTELPKGDYGPPIKHDPDFQGPVHRRSCTDIICLLVFIVFITCWVAICCFGYINGDARKLLAPTDSKGRKCGLTSGVQDRPNLVFFDLEKCLDPQVAITGCPTTQMCVEKCPEHSYFSKVILEYPEAQFIEERKKLVCEKGVNTDSITQDNIKTEYFEKNLCAKNIFKSTSISSRCIPTNFTDVGDILIQTPTKSVQDQIKELEKVMNRLAKAQQMGARIIEDLINLKWVLLLCLFLVMVVCIIYIAIMRWIAGPVIWFTLLAIIALLSYSIYLCYENYIFYKSLVPEPSSNTNLAAMAESITSSKDTWLVLMILACIALAVVVLLLLFLRKRIVLAIALIKEGSRAVGSVKSTLFFPIFPWVLQVALVALAVSACMFLATIGEDQFKAYRVNATECSKCPARDGEFCEPSNFSEICNANTDPDSRCDAICQFVGIVNPEYIQWFQAVNVVGFIWSEFFIQGVGEMILAGAFATWYWTFHKSNVPFFTLTASVTRTIFNNLGTVALGSLIITICRLIRILIEYVDAKVRGTDNWFGKAMMCCCRCFFACLEGFLKFINKNAYIMCAIHGKNFFSSAKDAFSLLMRNIVRVFVLDKVTDFLFFLSKLVVALGCGTATYFALRDSTVAKLTETQDLHYDLVPALIVGVGAYLIASMFFGVYSMAVDTLFLCFLEDCERNDGSPERPYFMSKQLMKILGKKNKHN